MKTFRLLSIVLLGIIAVSLMAETQTGYVRTIGRNGKPGQPISGVMVRAEGPANMVMSDAQGQFTLTLHEATRDDAYRLASVKKSNYELLDKDVIGREYGFTTVPMEIVLVNLTEMQAEKAAMAERFERQYAETYQKKMAELQAQYEAKQITGEEYATREEELTKALETMLAQIETLVDRYVRTDYDRLDSLDQVINAHIEQGEFDEAERLIRSKGSIEERLAALHERQDVQRQLEEATRQVAKANEKDKQNLKRDLSLLIDIADAHLRPDSAYYYRKQLAEVNPEDVNLFSELMSYAWTFEEYEMCHYYFDKADSIYKNSPQPDTLEWAKLYDMMGENLQFVTHNAEKEVQKGYEYCIKAKDLLCSYYGENSINCAGQCEILGSEALYLYSVEYCGDKYRDYAELYYGQATQIYNNILAQDSNNLKAQYGLFSVHTSASGWRGNMEENRNIINAIYEKAAINPESNGSLIKEMLEYLGAVAPAILSHDEVLHKIMDYYPSHLYNSNDSASFIRQIRNMVIGITNNGFSSRYADSCLNYAVELAEKGTYDNETMGTLFLLQKKYDKALEYYELEMQHCVEVYGVYAYQTSSSYFDVACIYRITEDYGNALEYYRKALVAYERLKQPISASLQYDIGCIYQIMDDKKRAKEWYEKALKNYQEFNDKYGISETKEALDSLKKKK